MVVTATLPKDKKKNLNHHFNISMCTYDSFKGILLIKLDHSEIKKIKLSNDELERIIKAFKTQN